MGSRCGSYELTFRQYPAELAIDPTGGGLHDPEKRKEFETEGTDERKSVDVNLRAKLRIDPSCRNRTVAVLT